MVTEMGQGLPADISRFVLKYGAENIIPFRSHAYMQKRADQVNLLTPNPMSWMCYDTYETIEVK